MKRRVLILCTGNSCRSQMAEAWWRKLGGGHWEVHSAGSRPAGFVHPRAAAVMREAGMDLSGHHSKSVEAFRGQTFDVVVTVCDGARDACPSFPGGTVRLHWPFEDPAKATGDSAERDAVFRRVRDAIRERIEAFLAESESRSGAVSKDACDPCTGE